MLTEGSRPGQKIATMTLTIPDSIVQSLRLPVQEVEPRIRTELALSLRAEHTFVW